MTEQWQELKETITEMRDNDGPGTQQDVCKFLVNYMETLEKQMQQPCEDCISREEVQDLISRWLSDYLLDETREALETINYKVGDMPSVTPKAEPCEDCISILNRIMEYTYGMLTAEKIGLQHLIKSMIDEMSGGKEDEASN